MKNIRILGIDPGLANSGWGVVDSLANRALHRAHGCIITRADTEHALRLLHIYREIRAVIDEWKPEACAMESLYFAKNAKTAMPVGEARGVLCLAMAESDIPIFEYGPNAIKQAVTGTGSADKTQVQNMVRVILGLVESPRPDHAADALGAAICHCHSAV